MKDLRLKIGVNWRIWIKAEVINKIQTVYDAIKEGMKLSGEEREVYLNRMFNK